MIEYNLKLSSVEFFRLTLAVSNEVYSRSSFKSPDDKYLKIYENLLEKLFSVEPKYLKGND